MKASIIIVLIIGAIYCQIDQGTAINSCGKIGYDRPASSEDCKPGGENSLCCYVDIPNRNMKYCSFMPNTKLEDSVVTEFKDVIGETNLNIICNQSNSLSMSLLTQSILVFTLLFL